MRTTEVREALQNADRKIYRYFGIRMDDRNFEIGEEIPASENKDWELQEEEELEGVSCIEITANPWDEDEEIEENLEEVIAYVEKKYALGEYHLYLIGGYDGQDGQDDREIVIPFADVIAVIK